jgi:membrane fusion protein (multidrug efflux system)
MRDKENDHMMKKMIVGLMIISLIIFSGCGYKKKNVALQSMEQIHKATGVPVKTQVVKIRKFSTMLKYSATVQARSEAVKYSRVADVVQQVFFKVGDYVRKNQVVVTFPKNNQTTQYYQLKAAYDLAGQTYRRMANLYQEGVVSKQELDNTQTNFEVAKANLNTTEDSLKVKAPLSGYITQLNVKPTDNVNEDGPLFTVSNLDLVEAQLWASSQEAGQIKCGQKVILSWNGRRFAGSISQVGRIMDLNRKAFEVKALFKNIDQILTSGITAEVAIETYTNENAVMIHRKDLVSEGANRYVYIVANGIAVKKEVKLGAEQGVLVEVKFGLKPGDRLIVEGNKMVENQAKVQVVKS